MTDKGDELRLTLGAAMIARLEADHAAIIQHASILAATLNYLATMIVLLEPNAGAAETFLASFVGGLVLGTGVAAPLAGLAATLTLMTEKGLDAELMSWAKARLFATTEGP